MNDIANSTSAAAIAAATSAPASTPAPAPAAPAVESAPSIPSAAVAPPAVAESPAPAASNTAQDTPAAPSTPQPEARPAQELQATFLDEGPQDPPPPAKDAPVDPAQPEKAPAEKDVAPVEAAPIVYEFAYPEDFQKEALDPERFAEFTSTLNAVKAPPEQAQKFLDMHLTEVRRAQIHALDQVWQSYHKQQNDWKAQIRDDREFGGDRLPVSKAEANAFIEQYGGSAEEQAQLRRDLFQTGAGNSPALVKAMIRAGKALSREGTPVIVPPPRQVPMNRQQRGEARYAGTNTPGSR